MRIRHLDYDSSLSLVRSRRPDRGYDRPEKDSSPATGTEVVSDPSQQTGLGPDHREAEDRIVTCRGEHFIKPGRASTACTRSTSLMGSFATRASAPGVSSADLWERAAFLEPRLPHQRADTDPRDSGLPGFARRPESDPRAPWRPSVPANPAQGSLATETANPTPVERLRCLADRVRPERATRLKPESIAPHTYSQKAATGAIP